MDYYGKSPKMVDPLEFHEWFLEEHFHLPSTFDDQAPIINPTYSDLNPNYSAFCTQNLDTFGTDFHLFNENPPLSEHAWEPLSQLTPLTFNINDQLLFADFGFNDDQSLDMIVTEGITMSQQSLENFVEGKIVNNSDCIKEKFKKIKGENYNTRKIETIDYEEIRKYFDVPISKAAKELNVGLTALKKRCRELNIKRWPQRKIKSLEALISNVKEEQGMTEMVNFLEDYKRKLQYVPGLELNEETKRLRQQFFKANYKKKRALALTRGHLST